ncbi:hypothetical protein Hanom_Chr12g01146771 [Helianthus anomalus]
MNLESLEMRTPGIGSQPKPGKAQSGTIGTEFLIKPDSGTTRIVGYLVGPSMVII